MPGFSGSAIRLAASLPDWFCYNGCMKKHVMPVLHASFSLPGRRARAAVLQRSGYFFHGVLPGGGRRCSGRHLPVQSAALPCHPDVTPALLPYLSQTKAAVHHRTAAFGMEIRFDYSRLRRRAARHVRASRLRVVEAGSGMSCQLAEAAA